MPGSLQLITKAHPTFAPKLKTGTVVSKLWLIASKLGHQRDEIYHMISNSQILTNTPVI